MTTAQQILLDFDAEMATTRRFLQRVPMDDQHRAFKPHPKSMTLGRLATHIAELPGWHKLALAAEEFEIQGGFVPRIASTSEELLAIFDQAAAEGRATIDAASDDAMLKSWAFKFGGKVVYSDKRPAVVRSFMNHLVHHRGMLGVYLRLLDVPVPGAYGPSSDEQAKLD